MVSPPRRTTNDIDIEPEGGKQDCPPGKSQKMDSRYPPRRNSGMTRHGEQLTARSMDVNEMKIFDEVNMNTSV
jgi:hypothetical protein